MLVGTLPLLDKVLLCIAKGGHSGFGLVLCDVPLLLRLFLGCFGIGQFTIGSVKVSLGCIPFIGNSVDLALNIAESDERSPAKSQNCYK